MTHLTAHVRTGPAKFFTSLHLLIFGIDGMAISGTAVADLRAGLTGERLKFRTTGHKIRARLADLRTIEQKPDMRLAGMISAAV